MYVVPFAWTTKAVWGACAPGPEPRRIETVLAKSNTHVVLPGVQVGIFVMSVNPSSGAVTVTPVSVTKPTPVLPFQKMPYPGGAFPMMVPAHDESDEE